MGIQPGLQTGEIFNLGEFAAVTVENRARKTHSHCLFVALDVEIGGPCRVHRHEYVRNNPASSIDPAAGFGVIDLIRIDFYAVGRSEFSPGVPFVDIVGIMVRIGLLDATARRSVKPCDSEPYPTSIGEVYRFLHQSFSE